MKNEIVLAPYVYVLNKSKILKKKGLGNNYHILSSFRSLLLFFLEFQAIKDEYFNHSSKQSDREARKGQFKIQIVQAIIS